MTIVLTVMLALISLGILAGRVYEIVKITDANTGFFIYKGIVFNPYILAIFAVITVCCAVIIFGGSKDEKPFFSKSSKIIAAASGGMFIVYGAMSLHNLPYALPVISGGLMLVIIGTLGLNPQADIFNIVSVILSVIFAAGLCLDVIIFNVNTIHNIAFVKNAMTYIAAALFIMFVMQNVYRPSAASKMYLYITGVLAFLFCGIMNVADIIAMAIDGQSVLPDLFLYAGWGFFGFFAFDNAVSVMPRKKIETEATEKISEIPDTSYNEQTDNTKEDDIVKTDDIYSAAAAETKTVFTRSFLMDEVSQIKENRKVVYKKPKN